MGGRKNEFLLELADILKEMAENVVGSRRDLEALEVTPAVAGPLKSFDEAWAKMPATVDFEKTAEVSALEAALIPAARAAEELTGFAAPKGSEPDWDFLRAQFDMSWGFFVHETESQFLRILTENPAALRKTTPRERQKLMDELVNGVEEFKLSELLGAVGRFPKRLVDLVRSRG